MELIQRFEIIRQKIKERLALEAKTLTDITASAFLEVSKGTYRRWKSGHEPEIDAVRTMATKLDLSAEWLLLGTGNPEAISGRNENAPAVVNNSERITLLVQDNKRLEDLLATKDEVIALQRELADSQRKRLEQAEAQTKKDERNTSSSSTTGARTC